MMFAMWPGAPRASTSLENVYTYGPSAAEFPVHQFDYHVPIHGSFLAPACSGDFFRPAERRTSDAATQTEEFDERDRRCHRVTLALLRSSFDFELRLELNADVAARSRIGRCLDALSALFAACYRPIVINGP